MHEIKKENPDANWGNLLTGVMILVLIAVFSIWYFGGTPDERADSILNVLDSGQVEETVVMEDKSGTTTALAGEGLWQIAERECGDGENYNVLADANGLSIWSNLNEGQELVVVCSN